jgi:tRNA A37 threonylcarbamoyladenosine dehydratase
MLNEFSRTQLLLGPEAMEKLAHSRVAVFGIGGVGGYTVEALARSGVGALDLIDDDKVCLTNINRQILATRKTVGKHKVDVAAERIGEINPRCVVRTYKTFYLPDTAEKYDFSQYDYVVDAIDTVSGKIQLVLAAKEAGTPIISSMGAGNKLDATAFRVADISQTSVCPLARVMRRELKKARHPTLESRLFKRKTAQAAGGSEHQLPRPLHLPAGDEAPLYRQAGHSRFRGFRAVSGRADYRGGSGKGFV